MSRPRKPADIEKLLQWAFRDELPKGMAVSASAWSALQRLGDLGCRVQEDYVGMAVRSSLGFIDGEPHKDAKTIGLAVNRLVPSDIDWEASRDHLMGDMLPLAVYTPWLERINTAVLVVSNAVMGTRPVWDLGTPEPQKVMATNGKPMVSGECYGAARYSIGAFCPLTYADPTPQEVVAARAEYSVWHAALCRLADDLYGELQEHDAQPPACSAEPWNLPDPPSKVWYPQNTVSDAIAC